jgi:hypothetical protein
MTRSILTGAVAVAALALATSTLQAQKKGDGPGTRTPTSGQPNVAPAPEVPTGETSLGQVRIPRKVMANGQALGAGTYQVRLTAEAATPPAVGITTTYERWVEFVQGGQVKGKEVVSIVPQGEIKTVAEDSPPGAGGSKVQVLHGNDYLRVWINRGGIHYLVHLPMGAG